jgi:hypothetical protein
VTATITEQGTEIPATVLAAFKAWQDALESRPPVEALQVADQLVAAADTADVPLCVVWGRFCFSPHTTVRSCCQDAVCDDHEPEHDKHCPELLAQLREEAGL